MQYGILLHGGNHTAGWGKTHALLRLAIEVSQAIVEVHQLPREDAVVVYSQTLDGVRDLHFKLGSVLVLDDWHPNDREQTIYISERAMTGLLNPRMSAVVRARNQDIALPASVPRFFSAQVDDPVDWVRPRIEWSQPLQRRCITFKVDRRLCAEWGTTAQSDSSIEAVGNFLAGLNASLVPPTTTVQVQHDVSRVRSMLRSALGMIARGAAILEPSRTVNHNGHLVTI